MQNLTRLLDRESKWYRLGPFVIGRGVPKKLPFYALASFGIFWMVSEIPYSPFWFLIQSQLGWMLLYLVFPWISAAWMYRLKRDGKSPERYLWSILRSAWLHKHVNPFRPIHSAFIVRLVFKGEGE